MNVLFFVNDIISFFTNTVYRVSSIYTYIFTFVSQAGINRLCNGEMNLSNGSILLALQNKNLAL